ncbi:hypothetical protein EX30DRAFT_188072 [Ascodesmis nigricans]|uniref:Uncharacterized protein n=1 Tax=Ascodesmis nigricans TaxID=341454 RepID=A0A4S2N0A1_9PEZI|nr:hypothetical protein EX30DRAFT_188072 [Ascodesmis nigricans]
MNRHEWHRDVSQRGPSRQQLYDPRVTSTGFEDTLPSSTITPTEHHDRIQEALRYQSTNDSTKSPNMSRQQSTQAEKITDSATGTPINLAGLDSLEVFKDLIGDKYHDGPPSNANGAQDVTSFDGSNNQTQNHDETGGTTPIGTHQNTAATVEHPQDREGAHQESGTFENSCAGSSDHRPLLHVPSTETSELLPGVQLPGQFSNDPDGAAAPIVPDETNQSKVKSSDSLLPALLQIGNNLKKWCPGCGHQGHSGLEFHSCPTGRLVRYIMSTGTKEYALMHKADGILHFVNDRHHLIDGMTYLAFRLQEDSSTETIYRLKQTGAKLMRAILKVLNDPLYGQFIRPADPTQNPMRLSEKVAMHQLTASFFNLTGSGPSDELKHFEDWTNFNVPFVGFEDETGSEMMEITEAYSRFQEAVHASRLQSEDFNLSRPLNPHFQLGLGQNTNQLEANLPVYINDEYLPVQGNDEKDKKKRVTTSDPPESNRTKYRRGIDTSIYDGVETEILGGRASVRCSTCLMRGHTLTATKTCPIGMLDRALNCASARTKIQWTSLKPKADKACGQLEGVIALLDKFPEEKARLRKKIAEYRELDPVTGRPRYARKFYTSCTKIAS